MRIIYLPNKIYKLYDYAKKFTFKKYKDMDTEERAHVDHMTVTKNGRTFKHFQAWERKSKILVAQVYSRARNKDAAKFLKELVKDGPYKILSIQVDGGSEFMKEFEETCQELSCLFCIQRLQNITAGFRILRKNFMKILIYWLILSVPCGTNYKECLKDIMNIDIIMP